MKTPVAHATVEGSTRGTAEHIASGRDHNGYVVDVRRLAAINSVGDESIAVGSVIHSSLRPTTRSNASSRTSPARVLWPYSVSSVGTTSSLLSPRLARYLRRMPRTRSHTAPTIAGGRAGWGSPRLRGGQSRPARGQGSTERVRADGRTRCRGPAGPAATSGWP